MASGWWRDIPQEYQSVVVRVDAPIEFQDGTRRRGTFWKTVEPSVGLDGEPLVHLIDETYRHHAHVPLADLVVVGCWPVQHCETCSCAAVIVEGGDGDE